MLPHPYLDEMYHNTPPVSDQRSQNPNNGRCTLKSTDEKKRPLEFSTSYLTVQALGVRENSYFWSLCRHPPLCFGEGNHLWTPPRCQALVQAFSYTWSDLIFTIILWGSPYPVFQTGNQRLREFTRQWSGCPSIWIQGQLSPKSTSFPSHRFTADIRKFRVHECHHLWQREPDGAVLYTHSPQPQLPSSVIHQKQGPIPGSQAFISHL